ncbi:hypothetical protein [Roseimaritima sediminicola]|uniref:hypothetical protein n=1 Tax=Roseimaritima sediminicola TaxID=2662066 RepID=UPI0012983048|nr:hypothetical protein [Roseimaritima sediminicola]
MNIRRANQPSIPVATSSPWRRRGTLALLVGWLFCGSLSAQPPTERESIRVPGAGVFSPRIIDIPVEAAPAIVPDRPRPPSRLDRGRLTTEDAARSGLVLEAVADRPARMARAALREGQFWVVVPIDADVVRLQLVEAGDLWSLAASGPAGAVGMERSRQDARQLWRAVAIGGVLRLDSVAYPGRSLAGSADGLVQLERTSDGEAQHWLANFDPPPPALTLPPVRMVRREVRPQPGLPAVDVRLVNTHRDGLLVSVIEMRSGRVTHRVDLPPRGSQTIRLQRDAGAAIVERYQVVTPGGIVHSEEIVTSLPPQPLYSVAVYERYLASIAIDRTGKSPNVVEDINYQSRGVGQFLLPAGAELDRGASIDVYARARAMRNPGSLPPIRLPENDRPGRDPLQQTLDELGVPRR